MDLFGCVCVVNFFFQLSCGFAERKTNLSDKFMCDIVLTTADLSKDCHLLSW